ncbi:MAG TPA: hypothetical protein VJW76_13490 [Verrucomicrobiae bacterium]|nr:hypothetical protein [Verrucomicrobiae bacterium]
MTSTMRMWTTKTHAPERHRDADDWRTDVRKSGCDHTGVVA